MTLQKYAFSAIPPKVFQKTFSKNWPPMLTHQRPQFKLYLLHPAAFCPRQGCGSTTAAPVFDLRP